MWYGVQWCPVFVDWSYHSQVIALLKHHKFFYEIHFYIKFYNGFILKILACTIMLGFRKLNHILYLVKV